MTEHFPNSDLEHEIKEKFKYLPNDALIERIEKAEPFKSDDLEVELSRRVRLGGLAWRYAAGDKIEVYDPRETAE